MVTILLKTSKLALDLFCNKHVDTILTMYCYKAQGPLRVISTVVKSDSQLHFR